MAAETYDEESRLRYVRLEQTYLQLAESEDPLADHAPAFIDEKIESPRLIA